MHKPQVQLKLNRDLTLSRPASLETKRRKLFVFDNETRLVESEFENGVDLLATDGEMLVILNGTVAGIQQDIGKCIIVTLVNGTKFVSLLATASLFVTGPPQIGKSYRVVVKRLICFYQNVHGLLLKAQLSE